MMDWDSEALLKKEALLEKEKAMQLDGTATSC